MNGNRFYIESQGKWIELDSSYLFQIKLTAGQCASSISIGETNEWILGYQTLRNMYALILDYDNDRLGLATQRLGVLGITKGRTPFN